MQTYQKKSIRVSRMKPAVIVDQACAKVPGFKELYNELKRSITIRGQSESALANYSRQLAHLAIYYNRMPLELQADEVMDYLFHLKSTESISDSFFNFTIHGMRYACKMRGMPYTQFSLPEIKSPKQLPIVLNGSEIKTMLKACHILKYRLMIAICYGCGLRSSELQYLQVSHIDTVRKMLHIHQGKGSKDRCVPLGNLLCRGIEQYLVEEIPSKYMFISHFGKPYTTAGIAWVVKQAVTKAGIQKDVHTHTLRHSYAIHLLENGVNIMHIKELLGHKSIESTMIYLRVAQPVCSPAVNPLDVLYGIKE
ncbi:MAG: site-specific integrase [Tannerella sp.]|jgi:site-specific recombinase XerD|nr:site-specific integrase [Tannerella sp.]